MWSICLPRSMLRDDLWHFYIHKLRVPLSSPQYSRRSPLLLCHFVLLPFHRNRLKSAWKVIFMAPGQVQKANVKTEANCWKRSSLLSSDDTWTGEQVPYQWKKKKPWAKSVCCIFSSIPGSWEISLTAGERERICFGWNSLFFFLNRIKIGGTGRHACL